MSERKEITLAVRSIADQINELEAFIYELLRENKPENAGLIAAMLDDIKKRNAFH